jgi:hypothetical protein
MAGAVVDNATGLVEIGATVAGIMACEEIA